MLNKRVRIGIIGSGRVAESHIRALRRCPDAAVTAITSRTRERAAARAREWGITHVETVDEIVSSPNLDAIFVLTNTESHFEQAMAAVQHGKHVLVEKPVSYVRAEIKMLEQAARENGVHCVPGHSYLYLPEIQRAVRYISEKTIREPFYMYMSEIYRMPEEYINKYHGPIREVLCHEFYLMLALLGLPERISAFGSRFRAALKNVPEQVIVNATFADGALAQIFLSWAGVDQTSEPWTFKLKVLGQQGGLHFSRRDCVTHEANGESLDYPLYDEMFEAQDEYFIKRCLLAGEKPLSNLSDARLALALMEMVEESIAEGKAVATEGLEGR